MTALQRLIKHPHPAVFDASPDAEVALRLRHPSGASWSVADEVLVASAGGVEHRYALGAMTVANLASRLRADGFEVADVSPAFAGLQAAVLVEGSGAQAQSNGDRVTGFTSLMWSLFGGYARELRTAKTQVGEALRQMVIPQAEGEWLDVWGSLYDQPRLPGERDEDYAPRIPREAFRVRLNARAIEKAIWEATGKDVRIEEPWSAMFRLDESALSGAQAFYDGARVGYHLIRPVSSTSIDWTDVLAVIDRNKTAGVIVLPPEIRVTRLIDARLNGSCAFGITSDTGSLIPVWTDSRLDYMVLSDEELVVNYGVTLSNVNIFSNAEGLLDPQSISTRHTIAMASMALSDGPALGDENAIFPRAELIAGGKRASLSQDAELSGVDARETYRPVDRVTIKSIARVVAVAAPQDQGHAQLVQRLGYGSLNPVDGTTSSGQFSARSGLSMTSTPIAVFENRYGNTTDPDTGNDIVTVSGPMTFDAGVQDADTLEVGP